MADAVDADLTDLVATDVSGHTTLRAAFQQSTYNPGAQEVWLPAWQHRLTLTGVDDVAAMGDLDITDTVTIVGTGAGLSVIDGGGMNGLGDRLFEVHGTGGNLSISRVTLTGADINHNGTAVVVLADAKLSIDRSAVVDNNSFGGALYVLEGATSVSITNSVIANNTASSTVGGIRTDMAGTKIGNTIIANNFVGSNPSDVFEGGMNGSFLSLGNNLLTTNFGATGSFIDGENGDQIGLVDPSITNPNDHFVVTSIVDAVDADLSGESLAKDASGFTSLRAAIQQSNFNTGAQEVWLPAWEHRLSLTGVDDVAAMGDLDITDTVTIVGTGAGLSVIHGGGAAGLGDRLLTVLNGGDLTISRLALTGADHNHNGAAVVVVDGGSLSIDRSALVDNKTTSYGGALYVLEDATSVSITNSVIANNTAPSGGGGIRNDFNGVQVANTIIANNSSNDASRNDVYNALAGSTFTSLGNNVLTSTGNASADFVNDYVGPVDHIVTTEDDELDVDPTPFGDLSLREALELAADNVNYPGADTIVFAPWVQEIDLTLGQLLVDSDVTIKGLGADLLTIDGTGANTSVFYVSAPGTLTVEISDLTVTGSSTSASIRNYETLTLKSMSVLDNTLGRGVYNSNGGDLTLDHSVVSGNSGGGHPQLLRHAADPRQHNLQQLGRLRWRSVQHRR